MLVTGKLQQWGNSYGIRISKKTAKQLKLKNQASIIIDINPPIEEDGFGMCKGASSFKRDPNDDRGW